MSEQETKGAIEAALKNFADRPLADAALQLYGAFGYSSNKRLKLTPNSFENFLATFAQGSTVNEKIALPNEWKSIDFHFQLTGDEIRATGDLKFVFESKGTFNGAVIESYIFFALELMGTHYTRT